MLVCLLPVATLNSLADVYINPTTGEGINHNVHENKKERYQTHMHAERHLKDSYTSPV